jgi:dihydropyrimidine dehydrogenase (NADP+)
VRIFKEMGIAQVVHPEFRNMPKSYSTPIALIGAGPASISCATFLARLGYTNIHIYEKNQHGGGIVSHEIPGNRAPLPDALWEVELVQQLGVKIHYGKALGVDFTIEGLRKEGYEAIFLGFGLPKPNMGKSDQALHKSILKAQKTQNFFNSKDFLPDVLEAVKFGNPEKGPRMNGHVLVLGIGDTALDCARSAFRLGASRVSVAFRKGTQDMRCNDEIFVPARNEGINFIPYSAPLEYKLDPSGTKVISVKFDTHLPQNNDYENMNYAKTNQFYELPVDAVVQAFGCQLPEDDWLKPLKKSDSL